MPTVESEPLVSVIVCVYNGADLLAATLESALQQTYRSFELLVIDDGSTDGSTAVLKGHDDPRLKLIEQRNGGAAAALITGLRAARGTYVAFLDQDDLWDRDKLAMHVKTMQDDASLDLTFSWFQYIGRTGRPLGIHSIRYCGSPSFAGLLEDFVIGATSNVVLRREAVEQAGGVDPQFPRVYDLDLFLRVALLRPGNVRAIQKDLMGYRRHKDQITRDIAPLEREWERVAEKMLRLAPDLTRPVLGRARQNIRRYFARLEYEQGRYSRALRHVGKGFAASPVSFLADPRNWITAAASLAGSVLPHPLLTRLERMAGLDREGA
jgi:glycosyltransferase involved in cell wall biosynthesis